jgi:queuine/archaeosine tRNA-ribosyltransferase
MAEVLHFTDYPFRPRNFREWFPHTVNSTEVKTLQHWVRHSFQELGRPQDTYHPLFFLDSGGFRLLFNREVDISEFGYEPTQESILDLQLAYGADLVASLDFPIPPFLDAPQVKERTIKSVDNAVHLMELLYKGGRTDANGKRPFPILAVHGQTPRQIREYIVRLFQRLNEGGFCGQPFGIGIGSLVPLRTQHQADKIVLIVKAVMDTLYGSEIPSGFTPDRIPVHAFGITGDMIPVLAHLGVDTFDSSSYVKSASVLDYYDPITWTSSDFRKLETLHCQCDACRGISNDQVKELQAILAGGRVNGNQERLGRKIGAFTVDIKSDVYGIIAYHNLNLQDSEIAGVRRAIEANETAEHLVRFSKVHRRAQELVEFVAEIDPTVARSLGHVQVELFPRSQEDREAEHDTISLMNDPCAFQLTMHPDFTVPSTSDRLLILACSQAKPYRQSKSHATIQRAIVQAIGEKQMRHHKVTLSGLYGPVPLEFEDLPQIRRYEYVLSATARKQRELITARLVSYIEAHRQSYRHIVAFVTARAYRMVVEAAFARVKENYARTYGDAPYPVALILVPAKSHGTGTKDLLSHASIDEMLSSLYPELSIYRANLPLYPLSHAIDGLESVHGMEAEPANVPFYEREREAGQLVG